MRSSRLLTALAVTVVAVGVTVGVTVPAASAAPVPTVPDGLPAAVAAQLDALTAAKNARTPAQRKISSQLLIAAAQRSGGRVASGVGPLTTTAVVAKDGTVHATVRATAGADIEAVAKRVDRAGGRIRAVWKSTVDADVPLSALTALAASADVRRIDPADEATLADASPTPTAAPGTATPKAGSTQDEGDVALGGDVARATYRVRGSGITVGVLSDGVDSLAASIASGDLPAGTRALDGQEGVGDEGTAMLEIVHDVAPTAKLLFATAFTSADSFAANIVALRAAGADVIVDDVLYYSESPFQDGPIAQAVRTVTAGGALFFSSAGNEGNLDDGTSGTWEGDFVPSGRSIGKFKGIANDFAPGAKVQAANSLSDDSSLEPTALFWADPLGAAADDYDLYVVDPTGAVVAMSNDTQDGDDDPFEFVRIPSEADLRVAVVKYKGAARYLQVTTFGGRFEDNGGVQGYATPGATRGHSAVPAAFSVAAVPAADPLPFAIKPGLKNPSGPYPGTYTAKQKTEVFSSDGPRRVFFAPDGTPLTPGDTSATGGQVRNKPDLTSADGVSTSLSDFDPFFGTSAAAPHAAALAALVLSGNPGLSPARVRQILTSSAVDIEAPGDDRDTGFGIPLATGVLARSNPVPQPRVVANVTEVVPGGDGDAYLEPGESARVTLQVHNVGDGTASNITVTARTPEATVTPAVGRVDTLAQGATKDVTFTMAVPITQAPGNAVDGTVTVRFTGSLSPTSATFSLPVGQPTASKAFRYTGPAVAVPDNTPAGVDVPVRVSGVSAVSGVTFSIDGSDCTAAATSGIDQTYDNDLVGTLVAPDGTAVTLFSRTGSSGDNFCQTLLTAAATTSIQGQSSTAAPFTGSFLPAAGSFGALVGVPGNGTWKFHVSDNAAGDTGSVRAFTLRVAGYAS